MARVIFNEALYLKLLQCSALGKFLIMITISSKIWKILHMIRIGNVNHSQGRSDVLVMVSAQLISMTERMIGILCRM